MNDKSKEVKSGEIHRNRDGREGGCRDFSGKADERCDGQTNERKKKHCVGPPLEMSNFF